MKIFFNSISQNPLFDGIGIEDFSAMFSCMNGKIQHFSKGETILLTGNPVDSVGIIVSGGVHVVREDIGGKQSIITEILSGELFGEVFACGDIYHSPVTVMAAENSEILLINYRKIITSCSSSCVFHSKLIENMLKLMARKNLLLNQKIDILSKRTIRARLILFLNAHRGTVLKFNIPYNREELASYLAVDRSALSAELSRLKKENLISYDKNEFFILDEENFI